MYVKESGGKRGFPEKIIELDDECRTARYRKRPELPSKMSRRCALLLCASAATALDWHSYSLPIRGQLVLTDVHAVVGPDASLTVYAAGEAGVLLKLRDPAPRSGAFPPFAVCLNAGAPLYFYGVYSFDANHTLLSGFYDGGGRSYGVLQETLDGGATWTNDTVIDRSQWGGGSIQFADALHGLMPSTSGSVMWRTSTGGRTAAAWEEVTPQAGQWHSGDFVLSASGVAAVAGSCHCNSTTFGASWVCGSAEDASGMDGGLACAGAPGQPGTPCLTGGGEISAPLAGWVHTSADGGRSWGSARALTAAWPIRTVLAQPGGLMLAAGGDYFSSAGGAYLSRDGGRTWAVDLELGQEVKACRAVRLPALRVTRIFCVSAGSAGGSIVSADVPLAVL